MSRTERVELTVLCLVENGDKILLLNRKDSSWSGYTLPGGHVEPGEPVIDAVIREMKEETGLDVIDSRLVGIKNFPIDKDAKDGRYIVFLFKTDKFKGEIVSSAEGEISWVRRNELARLDVVEDFYETLKVFDDPNLSELDYEDCRVHEGYRVR